MMAATQVWRLFQASAAGGGGWRAFAIVFFALSLADSLLLGAGSQSRYTACQRPCCSTVPASQARLTRLPSMCSSIVTWKSTLTAASGAWLGLLTSAAVGLEVWDVSSQSVSQVVRQAGLV
jgi:hypothetical protein